MSLDRAFRLSFYLTLALACACLGYAEYPLLPEIALLVWPMGLVLVAGFLLEGRWSMSSGLANVVATGIAGVVALWTLYRLVNPPIGAAEGAPLPVRLLPHLGFLLIVLMLALLFRPKQLSNYWFLFGICFVAVALACALDSDVVFGLLLLAFLASGMWSLAIFYLWCGLRFPGWARQGANGLEARAVPVPWRGFGIWQAVRRCLLIATLAFVFFSLTPRASVYPWDMGGRSNVFQSGLGEPVVDLNRTGTVRLSENVAFEVQAKDAQGLPKLDLDPGQRWRSLTLSSYENGRWFNHGGRALESAGPKGATEHLPRPLEKKEDFPDLGPRQFTLTLTFSGRVAGRRLVLAEPVHITPEPPRVLIRQLDGQAITAWQLHSGVLPPLQGRQRCSFKQRLAPVPEPGINPFMPGEDPRGRFEEKVNVPGVRDWTIDRLHRLVDQGQLPAGDIQQNSDGNFDERHHERIARALDTYLSSSGDYSYTLELTRRDPSADPVYDFLCNVKEGHCERFASALAAMLRSIGIPARLVIGYRGFDHMGDGNYVVRESHAHAWVEVRIQRNGPCWLTLDPTPAADRQTPDGFWSSLWHYARQGGGALWQTFIIDYNAERQETAVLEILSRLGLADRPRPVPADGASDPGGVSFWVWAGIGLAGALAGWWLWRRLRARSRGKQPSALLPAVSFYGRLLAVLARRRSLRPQPAQTPQEFADLVGQRLRHERTATALADIPEQLTRLYYRVRYAARPLSATEQTDVDARLELLDQGLALEMTNDECRMPNQ
jgi:hypothetical protein